MCACIYFHIFNLCANCSARLLFLRFIILTKKVLFYSIHFRSCFLCLVISLRSTDGGVVVPLEYISLERFDFYGISSCSANMSIK